IDFRASLSSMSCLQCVFFILTAPTDIYTLSLHDALPICLAGSLCHGRPGAGDGLQGAAGRKARSGYRAPRPAADHGGQRQRVQRSEEHTSELQSRENLVCRLLLEKKKKQYKERYL